MVRYNIVWNGDVSSGCPVRSNSTDRTRNPPHRVCRVTARYVRFGRALSAVGRYVAPCADLPALSRRARRACGRRPGCAGPIIQLRTVNAV
jgi:hypothetical protein